MNSVVSWHLYMYSCKTFGYEIICMFLFMFDLRVVLHVTDHYCVHCLG